MYKRQVILTLFNVCWHQISKRTDGRTDRQHIERYAQHYIRTLMSSTRSWRVRLISALLTLYTATFTPLYRATNRLYHLNDSFIDNVDKFPELFPPCIRVTLCNSRYTVSYDTLRYVKKTFCIFHNDAYYLRKSCSKCRQK